MGFQNYKHDQKSKNRSYKFNTYIITNWSIAFITNSFQQNGFLLEFMPKLKTFYYFFFFNIDLWWNENQCCQHWVSFFFFLFKGHLNKIAVYTTCKLIIQGLQILTKIVGETGMNGNPVVQKGHWTKNILTMFRRLTAPQKFESFKLENPSSSTRCNIICFPFKSIFGSSYAVSVVSKLCKSKRLPIERKDQIKC